jgi:hypothetical protein
MNAKHIKRKNSEPIQRKVGSRAISLEDNRPTLGNGKKSVVQLAKFYYPWEQSAPVPPGAEDVVDRDNRRDTNRLTTSGVMGMGTALFGIGGAIAAAAGVPIVAGSLAATAGIGALSTGAYVIRRGMKKNEAHQARLAAAPLAAIPAAAPPAAIPAAPPPAVVPAPPPPVVIPMPGVAPHPAAPGLMTRTGNYLQSWVSPQAWSDWWHKT